MRFMRNDDEEEEEENVQLDVGCWMATEIYCYSGVHKLKCVHQLMLDVDFFSPHFIYFASSGAFFRARSWSTCCVFPFTVAHPDWRARNGQRKLRTKDEQQQLEQGWWWSSRRRDGDWVIFEHCCYRWMFNNCQSEYTSQMRAQHFFATAAAVDAVFFCLTIFTSPVIWNNNSTLTLYESLLQWCVLCMSVYVRGVFSVVWKKYTTVVLAAYGLAILKCRRMSWNSLNFRIYFQAIKQSFIWTFLLDLMAKQQWQTQNEHIINKQMCNVPCASNTEQMNVTKRRLGGWENIWWKVAIQHSPRVEHIKHLLYINKHIKSL